MNLKKKWIYFAKILIIIFIFSVMKPIQANSEVTWILCPAGMGMVWNAIKKDNLIITSCELFDSTNKTGSSQLSLIALNLNGKEIWRKQLRGTSKELFAVNKCVYVNNKTKSGSLIYKIGINDAQILDSVEINDPELISTKIIGENRIIVSKSVGDKKSKLELLSIYQKSTKNDRENIGTFDGLLGFPPSSSIDRNEIFVLCSSDLIAVRAKEKNEYFYLSGKDAKTIKKTITFFINEGSAFDTWYVWERKIYQLANYFKEHRAEILRSTDTESTLVKLFDVPFKSSILSANDNILIIYDSKGHRVGVFNIK